MGANDSAFPWTLRTSDTLSWDHGLTKRQHYASLAMQGLLSSGTYDGDPVHTLATDAVMYADALIEALETPHD